MKQIRDTSLRTPSSKDNDLWGKNEFQRNIHFIRFLQQICLPLFHDLENHVF